jgi:purine-binding chemotaxis protein CheW
METRPDTDPMKSRDHASGSWQVVVFGLGEERYATDVKRVQEIIRWTEPRSVTSSLPAVRGVINLRGKIIPVCDLKLCLGSDSAANDEDSKIVVVETAVGVCGLVVDEVHEVRTLAAAELDSVPAHASEAGFIEGIAKVGDQLIVLLEPDRLFGSALEDGDFALAA